MAKDTNPTKLPRKLASLVNNRRRRGKVKQVTDEEKQKELLKRQKKDELRAAAIKAEEDEYTKQKIRPTFAETRSHKKLLGAMLAMDGKRPPVVQRTEAVENTDEFHKLPEQDDSDRVEIGDVMQTLYGIGDDTDLVERLQALEKSAIVEKPAERFYVNQEEREALYENTRTEATKWQSVIEANKVAEHLEFPLQKSKILMHTGNQVANEHVPRNEMELEIESMLFGSERAAQRADEAARPTLTAAEERAKKAMDLTEAREKRALMIKQRYLIAQQQINNRRRNKIKSKSYRKHARLLGQREATKAMEKLKESDPEKWIEEMDKANKARIEERASMRHRGNRQSAKLLKRYGKFNDNLREALEEMRQKHAMLTQKAPESESEDEEDDSEIESSDELMAHLDTQTNLNSLQMLIHQQATESRETKNPWMSAKSILPTKKIATSSSPLKIRQIEKPEAIQQDASQEDSNDEESDLAPASKAGSAGVVVYHAQKGQQDEVTSYNESLKVQLESVPKPVKAVATKKQSESDDEEWKEEMQVERDEEILEQWRAQNAPVETTRRLRTLADVEELAAEEPDSAPISVGREQMEIEDLELDPEKVIKVSANSVPSTDLSGGVGASYPHNDGEDLDNDEQRINIAEAFADDDVVEEFAKQQPKEKKTPVNMNDKLPGWGKWAGAGLIPTKTRRLRLKRREKNAKQRLKRPVPVRINMSAIRNQPISAHQVSVAPWPYNSAKHFEAEMRHSIGKEWVPLSAHRKLIEPRVTTAMGTIISPMDKDEVQETELDVTVKHSANIGEQVTGKQYIKVTPKQPTYKLKRLQM